MHKSVYEESGIEAKRKSEVLSTTLTLQREREREIKREIERAGESAGQQEGDIQWRSKRASLRKGEACF